MVCNFVSRLPVVRCICLPVPDDDATSLLPVSLELAIILGVAYTLASDSVSMHRLQVSPLYFHLCSYMGSELTVSFPPRSPSSPL